MEANVASEARYTELKRPGWAPPAWLFGVVWPVLYLLLAVTIGYLIYYWYQHRSIDVVVFVPLVLNMVTNLTFRNLKDLKLALADLVLVVATLVWLLVALWVRMPEHRWLVWLNVPYLIWVLYALALQGWITAHN